MRVVIQKKIQKANRLSGKKVNQSYQHPVIKLRTAQSHIWNTSATLMLSHGVRSVHLSAEGILNQTASNSVLVSIFAGFNIYFLAFHPSVTNSNKYTTCSKSLKFLYSHYYHNLNVSSLMCDSSVSSKH